MSAIDQALERLASVQESRNSPAIQWLCGRNVLAGVFLIIGPIAMYFPLWVLASRMTSGSSVASLNQFYRAYIILSESWGLVKLLSGKSEEET